MISDVVILNKAIPDISIPDVITQDNVTPDFGIPDVFPDFIIQDIIVSFYLYAPFWQGKDQLFLVSELWK